LNLLLYNDCYTNNGVVCEMGLWCTGDSSPVLEGDQAAHPHKWRNKLDSTCGQQQQVVECNKQQQNRLQLSPEGWAHFALDHILEEGDACVFELLSNSPELPMFRVHIFRALLPTLDDDDTSKLVIADRLC
jgi:hypothetical protein